MKPLQNTEQDFNVVSYSMDQIDIKEEPLQDDLVSEFYNNVFSHKWQVFFIYPISNAVQV